MTAFRVLLFALLLMVVIYTIPVLMNHGIAPVFSMFFGDIMKVNWAGQFNTDFMGFLILSGIWLAWRHEFSAAGVLLGVSGSLLGIPFLTVYLLIASFQSNGDVVELFVGASRANAHRST